MRIGLRKTHDYDIRGSQLRTDVTKMHEEYEDQYLACRSRERGSRIPEDLSISTFDLASLQELLQLPKR